ncbi:MAG: anaerobic ribonucleoside-triphosphate reductase activating protein [Clostridiales bacterium]|jgi:anaerobic ribonucleoside-triphosphate reductase activating protein|nr:anaerobic ribonucleoside-triphosphate reductase activating protein [Clostridiales bacterium]
MLKNKFDNFDDKNFIDKKVRLAGIINDSIVDGPGLRLAVFFQGCNRNCLGCHNPHAMSHNGGNIFSTREILNIALSNKLLDGVTFTGGEPFLQSDSLYNLVEIFKKNNYHVAVYTGHTFDEILKEKKYVCVLNFTDILVDGAFIKNKKNLNLKYCGSSNQRVIDIKKTLKDINNSEKKICLNLDWL